MKLNNKAAANLWWIIIAAVIALMVVIVLLSIFTGRTQTFQKGLGDCVSKSGVCQDCGLEGCAKTKCSEGFKQPLDCPENKICCIDLTGGE